MILSKSCPYLGTLKLVDAELTEVKEEEVQSKENMKGPEIPLTLSKSGGDHNTNASQSSS